jgi:hypothetical protein
MQGGAMYSLTSEKSPKILGFPENEPRKILLVDVDSLFDLPVGFGSGDVYTFAVAALRKAYKLGWGVRFWATYPKSHYTRVMRVLQGCSIWDFADPQVEQPLLLRDSVGEFSLTTKLALLEQHFGEILDGDTKSQLVVVERDLTTAQALRNHTRGRIHIHLSPTAWPNLLAVGNGRFDGFLSRGLVA